MSPLLGEEYHVGKRKRRKKKGEKEEEEKEEEDALCAATRSLQDIVRLAAESEGVVVLDVKTNSGQGRGGRGATTGGDYMNSFGGR